ncbi:hypothetical protein GCM10020000_47000 [Streptomyces olivoverticillatus]
MAAMADGDHEVGAGEDHDLAGVDDLAGGGQLLVFDIGDGLEDGEEDVAVALQLGPLVGLDGVLDGQRVEVEHLGDLGELRLGRLVQAEPQEAVAVFAYLPDGFLDRVRNGLPDAVAVDHAVDDGRAERGAGRVAEVHAAAALPRQAGHFAQVADHRHTGLSFAGSGSGQCARGGSRSRRREVKRRSWIGRAGRRGAYR